MRRMATFFLGTTHGVQRLGKGLTGGVVSVAMTPGIRTELLRRLKHLHEKVGSFRDIPEAGMVAIKFAPLTDTHVYSEFLRELHVQHDLSHAPPITVGNRVFDSTRVVPMSYFGGILAVDGIHVGVHVMAVVSGKTMGEIVRNTSVVPPWIVSGLEYALCCCMLHGYIHADLHFQNAMVDPVAHRVTIIDFGRSVQMPSPMRLQFQTYLRTKGPDAIDAFWHDVAQPYADSALWARTKTVRSSRNYWTNVALLHSLLRQTNMASLRAHREKNWLIPL
jgi:serine/threonine protein kinase